MSTSESLYPSQPAVTGAVIGVIGGGQLARMMLPAANALNLDLRLLSDSPESSAAAAAHHSTVGDPQDLEALRRFAMGVNVLTFEHEHVPTEHLRALAEDGVSVQPGPEALLRAQDKLEMRRTVERLGLANPEWTEVHDVEQLRAFGARVGWPVVLKTPRGGYDGKGVLLVTEEELDAAEVTEWFRGAAAQGPLLAEERVPFTRELSALIARTASGQARAWPVVESIQVNSICDEVIAPAPGLDPDTAEAAQEAALRLAHELDVTGVMAVELFEVPGRAEGFLVNELAMRPHNSGHWTQDGSVTSQFEQHLRAVLDLPLGDTSPTAEVTVMKNCLGGTRENLGTALPEALAADPSARVHLYGKGVRPGRKLGHVNLTGPAQRLEQVRESAARVARIIVDDDDASA